MTSKELIQAHIGFLEQNMKHDSNLQPQLVSDDMLEIEAYKKVLKDLEVLEQLQNILSGDFLFRAFDYETAKRFRDYLKSNDLVKQWLEGETDGKKIDFYTRKRNKRRKCKS